MCSFHKFARKFPKNATLDAGKIQWFVWFPETTPRKLTWQCKITILNRRSIFIHGCFSIVTFRASKQSKLIFQAFRNLQLFCLPSMAFRFDRLVRFQSGFHTYTVTNIREMRIAKYINIEYEIPGICLFSKFNRFPLKH